MKRFLCIGICVIICVMGLTAPLQAKAATNSLGVYSVNNDYIVFRSYDPAITTMYIEVVSGTKTFYYEYMAQYATGVATALFFMDTTNIGKEAVIKAYDVAGGIPLVITWKAGAKVKASLVIGSTQGIEILYKVSGVIDSPANYTCWYGAGKMPTNAAAIGGLYTSPSYASLLNYSNIGGTMYAQKNAVMITAADGSITITGASPIIKVRIPQRQESPKIDLDPVKMTVTIPKGAYYRIGNTGYYNYALNQKVVLSITGVTVIGSGTIADGSLIQAFYPGNDKKIISPLISLQIPKTPVITAAIFGSTGVSVINNMKVSGVFNGISIVNNSAITYQYAITNAAGSIVTEWETLKSGKKVTLTTKDCSISQFITIRQMAIKFSTKAAMQLASNQISVAISAFTPGAFVPTLTPTPTPIPTATPSPTPTPTLTPTPTPTP